MRVRCPFLAKVGKVFDFLCKMRGPGIPQSLWKPLWFWLWLFNLRDGFGTWVSHLMVPELEQRSDKVNRARACATEEI